MPTKCNSCRIKKANYGFKYGKITHCGDCRLKNHLNLSHKIYVVTECMTVASFGNEDDNKAIHCFKHIDDGEVNVKNKKCLFPGCKVTALFGKIGIPGRFYCGSHAPDDYENTLTRTGEPLRNYKKCLINDCDNDGNCIGELGQYCTNHAPDGYKNRNSNICKHEDCTTVASFNLKGVSGVHYCRKHTPDGSVNKRFKYCIFDGCDKNAICSISGETKRSYCKDHTISGIKRKRDH